MTAEKQWRGENVTGYSNPAYDRIVDAFNINLDQNERVQQRAQLAKMISDDVPAIMLTYNPNMHAYVGALKNVSAAPAQRTTGRITWNIEKWELQ